MTPEEVIDEAISGLKMNIEKTKDKLDTLRDEYEKYVVTSYVYEKLVNPKDQHPASLLARIAAEKGNLNTYLDDLDRLGKYQERLRANHGLRQRILDAMYVADWPHEERSF